MAHFFTYILIWLFISYKKPLREFAQMSVTADKQIKSTAANVTRGCSRTHRIYRGCTRWRQTSASQVAPGEVSSRLQVAHQVSFTCFSNLRANNPLELIKEQFSRKIATPSLILKNA